MTNKATLAGGCFWCTEAIFKRINGVISVLPGYTGGKRENPTYEQVSTGATGHAEAIQLIFDPQILSYETILDVFFATHDPTTLNRQGADIGTQYRSAIFYHDDEQKQIAEKIIDRLNNSTEYTEALVTQLVPYTMFYPAEEYHVDFYDRNKEYPYCKIVIDPKVQKLMKNFKEKLAQE